MPEGCSKILSNKCEFPVGGFSSGFAVSVWVSKQSLAEGKCEMSGKMLRWFDYSGEVVWRGVGAAEETWRIYTGWAGSLRDLPLVVVKRFSYAL